MGELRLSGRSLSRYTQEANGIATRVSDPDAELFFVLLEGPDGRGYLRCDTGPTHNQTYSRLVELLKKFGLDSSKFENMGGGKVSIYRERGNINLLFQGTAYGLGKYDRQFLERTVNELLDSRIFTSHYESMSIHHG